jgi:hypothetical protein
LYQTLVLLDDRLHQLGKGVHIVRVEAAGSLGRLEVGNQPGDLERLRLKIVFELLRMVFNQCS